MKTVIMDLHTHLLERNVSPNDYWKRAVERKLDAVAITEHAEIGSEEAYYEARKKLPSGKLLIPGAEVFTDIGHVIVLADSPDFYREEKLFEKYIPVKKAIKIVKNSGWLLSIAHPWGFSGDSAAFIAGEKKVFRLVEKQGIGVEAYNGLIGNINSLVYDSNWVKKPFNFLDFLEGNKVAKKVKIDKIGSRVKSKLEARIRDVAERSEKALELGRKAEYVTAGSDAHSWDRIGAGIIKLGFSGSLSESNIIRAIREKENLVWVGPYVKEIGKDRYVMLDDPVKKIEILQGMKYATKRVISRKAGIKKIRKKIFKKDTPEKSD